MGEVKPPIRYFGAKWSIADWVVSKLPDTRLYVEVFGGSAAILLSRRRSHVEVFNDINGEVVHFWKVLRDSTEELARAVELTPFSRDEFELSFEPAEESLERARRFVVRSWQTRGGGYRKCSRSSWWYLRDGVDCNSPSQVWTRVPERLLHAADRVRQVLIEQDDWREILRRYDCPGALFYLDPPYLRGTRTYRAEYVDEMPSTEQHEKLLESVLQLEGAVALSGRVHELYDEALADWTRHDTQQVSRAGGHSTECLWLSPSAVGRGLQGELFA